MSTIKSVIKGVAEIVLNVHDLETMQSFYEQILGFEFHSQYPDDEPAFVFLSFNVQDSSLSRGGHPQMFALVDPSRYVNTRETFAGLDVTRSSLNHIAFEIDRCNFEREKERLEALNVKVQTREFPHLKALGLFFEDPEGNLLELICHDGSME